MLTRRLLVGAPVAAAGAAVTGCRGDEPRTRRRAGERPVGRPVATFVSTPDFYNGDVGDLSTLPTWDGGPNSLNGSWRRASAQALAAMTRHRPDVVLLAGDLVEGRWNLDTTGRAIFGPVSQGTDDESLAGCRAAITAAGGVYYGHHRRQFAARGLRLLPAVGDHELLDDRLSPDLDDRWSPRGSFARADGTSEPDNRYHLVPHAKATWAEHFTRRPDGGHRFANRPRGAAEEATAYAVDVGPRLRIITIDVFSHTPAGVRLGVFGRQLAWLRTQIRQAKRRGAVVVVQGHVPILRHYRTLSSGGLRLPDARDSSLYRVLEEDGADLYLCGEVHDTTVLRRDRGPVQITHGSIFRYAFNYLVGQVYADGLVDLAYYEMSVERASSSRLLWSTDETKWQRTELEYGEPVLTGRLRYRDGRVLRRTKKLEPYDPGTPDRWSYVGHLSPRPL